MKPFRFQQFEIAQDAAVFRVGTDAVLLGALAQVHHAKQVLEVGTGCGIISLMVAQRNPDAGILAIDINPDAVALSQNNFSNAPFSKRLKAQFQDYKNFTSDEKFDLIISNPPYFEVNKSEKDILARQRLGLDFIDLIQKSARLLSAEGFLTVIIPIESEKKFTRICFDNQLFIRRKINIKGILNAEPKRVVLEYSLKQSKPITEEFVIEKMPRVYSDEYLELTKDFHLFNKKAP